VHRFAASGTNSSSHFVGQRYRQERATGRHWLGVQLAFFSKF